MKAIVACDKKWGIGKNGDLLVHLPGDMAYFREKTSGKIIIVGRKTLESFPGSKPLPKRTNIVLTQNANYTAENCIICHSPREAAAVAGALDTGVSEEGSGGAQTDVFVCGGGEIYKMLLPWCDEILVTKIDAEMQADTFFPDLDADPDFEMVWESEPVSEKGMTYRFTKYERIK